MFAEFIRSPSEGYAIARSVRLDGSGDYFTRTPTATGNRKIGTINLRFRRAKLGTQQALFASTETGSSESTWFKCYLRADDRLTLSFWNDLIPSYRFRDTTAWYDLTIAWDTTAGSTGNVTISVNGEVLTAFDVANYPSAGTDLLWSVSGTPHYLGHYGNVGNFHFDGSLADVKYVDGQKLPASAFGETDPMTGSWRAKPPAVTNWGVNGFWLNFADPSALGEDMSGAVNPWTPVSLAEADSRIDSPSHGYPILDRNHVEGGAGLVYANGDLRVAKAATASDRPSFRATVPIPSSGKWYWEARKLSGSTLAGRGGIGLLNDGAYGLIDGAGFVGKCSLYDVDGRKTVPGGGTSYGNAINTNDVVSVLVDAAAGSLTFWHNGVSQGVAATGLTSRLFPGGYVHGEDSVEWEVNFGQVPFAYSPPAGFRALSTANLPTPPLKAADTQFDVVKYEGTGGSRSVGGLAFAPGLVWLKMRSGTAHHYLCDSVRGAGSAHMLWSSLTSPENAFNDYGHISALTADGFSVAPGTSNEHDVNALGQSYVAWCWKAGGTAVANTAGSIPTLVSANPQAGFSVITYTGTQVNDSIGHGLGMAPSFILFHCSSYLEHWAVYHRTLGPTAKLKLDVTDVPFPSGTASWQGQNPTDTLITIAPDGEMNSQGRQYVAYCWAEIDGFSKFGGYTGNGLADGPLVHCGFRPKFVLIKRTDAVGPWIMLDSHRDPQNADVSSKLAANSPVPENDASTLGNANAVVIDYLANGFKLRDGNAHGNANGGTYVFAAFADHPFGGKMTVPATAH